MSLMSLDRDLGAAARPSWWGTLSKVKIQTHVYVCQYKYTITHTQVGEGKVGEKGEKQYAEYFMPVNEHKKSLRGEKMYVNKSSEKTGGCRKAKFCKYESKIFSLI